MISDLRMVISALHKEEIITLRKYLSCFRAADDKTLELLDYLLSSKSFTDSDLQQMLYGKANREGYKKLVYRLKKKVYESLILDNNISRKERYSELFRSKFQVQKIIMQAQIIQGRGYIGVAVNLYDEAIDKCSKYELFDEYQQLLNLKRVYVALNLGEKAYRKLKEEIEKVRFLAEAVRIAHDRYTQLLLILNREGNNNSHIDFLVKSIQELEELYASTSSANIAFYLGYIRTQYFQEIKDYEKAAMQLKEIIFLLLKSPAVFSRLKLALAYDDLAFNQLYQQRFADSIANSDKALNYIPHTGGNYYKNRLIVFYALFYSEQYTDAIQLLNKLACNANYYETDFERDKLNYLLAYTHFQLGEFGKTDTFLSMTKALDKDKEGWNIGLRILGIMSDIERAAELRFNHQSVDHKIEGLRKHLSRSNGMVIRKRDMLIARILTSLSSEGLDVQETFRKHKNDIELLSDPGGEYCWEIRTPELFPFHLWFLSKLKASKKAGQQV